MIAKSIDAFALSISIKLSFPIPGENIHGKKGASKEGTGQKKLKEKYKKSITKAKGEEKEKKYLYVAWLIPTKKKIFPGK